ncbi:MAG: hypothetical protein COB02_13645 [Candidatus Cloacimonadota bacterium]|nr:MAG: hypothetical protein COB02_13645 [Candidatus Cloacimonadota bacterium]
MHAIVFFLFIISSIYSQQNKIDLLIKLSKKQVAWAQYELSNAYYEGKKIKKNERKAYRLMQKAAKQNYPKSSYALGVYHNLGIGCPISKIKAYAWINKSLDSGYKRAQNYLDKIELDEESKSIAKSILKRNITIYLHPKWVYLKSKDQKIKTNSKENNFLVINDYIYSKKSLTFSKKDYLNQSHAIEFGKTNQISIILEKSNKQSIETSGSDGFIFQ